MTTSGRTNLEIAVDLYEFGLGTVAQKFRNANPGVAEDQVEAHVQAWLERREPDAPGRLIAWPRTRA